MRLILLLLLASIIIAPASAGDYYKVWDETNKTVTIYKLPADKWMTIKLIESIPDLTTFTETFQISSNYNYAFNDLVDFKLRSQKAKGKNSIDTVSWYMLQNVTVNTTVNDYTPVNHSTYNETNQTWYNWTEYVLTGNHTVTSYKDVWQSFSGNGNIKKDQTLYFKMIARKKAETGAFSIQTIPMFMGLEESNLTWWNGSWAKKKPVLLNNTGNATTFTYHQVNLNVTYDGDMNNDFSDVRFVNDTDSTEQPYWIESQVNGSYANLWINFSSVPASVWTNSTYYLYYSNPSATYNNSLGGTNTFAFFDDFSGDLSKWVKTETTLNNIAIVNGELKFKSGIPISDRVVAPSSTIIGVWEWKQKLGALDATGRHTGFNPFFTSMGNQYLYTISGQENTVYFGKMVSSVQTNLIITAFTRDTAFHDMKLIRKNANGDFEIFIDGISKGTVTDTSFTTNSYIAFSGFNDPSDEDTYFDLIRVRSYASPEPSAETGAEESNTSARTQVIIIN